MQIINQCPNCAGSLEVKSGQEIVKCQYCGTSVTLDNPAPAEVPAAPATRAPAPPASGRSPIMKILIPFFILDFLAVLIIVPVVIFMSAQKKKENKVKQDIEENIQQTIKTAQQQFKINGQTVKIVQGMGVPLSVTFNGQNIQQFAKNPLWETYKKDHSEKLTPKAASQLAAFLKQYPMPAQGPATAPHDVVQIVVYKHLFLGDLEKKRRLIMRRHRGKIRWTLIPRPVVSVSKDMVARGLLEVLLREPKRVFPLHKRLVREWSMVEQLNRPGKMLSLMADARLKDKGYAKYLKSKPHGKTLDAIEALCEALDLSEGEG
ncbi:hypothetical protein KJ865_14185, partial [Myxococcota bacterium]|nr:hypothetical protein [Myxococcota bacterium]